jgi:hypothetical protein
LDASPAFDSVRELADAIDIAPAEVGYSQRGAVTKLTRLPATGWLIVETNDGAWLVVDAGPDAQGWQPGHAHADGLTFELWLAGQRAVVDYGVASYERDKARAETRATRSHNTVELAGLDSCEVWDAFRVGRRGHARVVSAGVSTGAALIELEHDGYAWLPGRPTHERRLTIGEGYLEVRDEVRGGRGDPFVSRIHFDANHPRLPRISAGPGSPTRRTSRWHAQHGDPKDADVYEVAGKAEGGGVWWRIEWE